MPHRIAVAADARRPDRPAGRAGLRVEPGALAGRRILVIEDDFLVAQVLVDLLEDVGAEVIGPIGWVEEALSFVHGAGVERIDGAVLDINLHGKTSYPVADVLARRSIRFIFATGYSNGAIHEAYRHYPRFEKPIDQQTLVAALAASGD